MGLLVDGSGKVAGGDTADYQKYLEQQKKDEAWKQAFENIFSRKG